MFKTVATSVWLTAALLTLSCANPGNQGSTPTPIRPVASTAEALSTSTPQPNFEEYLLRDLTAYFQGNTDNPQLEVSYELLRRGPTQTGLSVPKYYLWVIGKDAAGKNSIEGAVRIRYLPDRQEFEVTDFVEKSEVRTQPRVLRDIFPPALIDNIKKRASN